MVRLIGFIVFAFITGNAFTQTINQSDIPAVVLNAFQVKYPNAANAKWKLEKGNYQVDYKVNNKPGKLILDYKGSLLAHFQDLSASEIPRVVFNTIKTKVENVDLQDVEKQEKDGKTIYVTEFKIEGKTFYFRINENGELYKYREELKNNEVPESITRNIQNQFGKLDIGRAKYVEDYGNANYILGGDINGMENVFWFDTKSNLLKHTRDLKTSEIPAPVLNSITASFKDYDIRDADLVEIKGKTSFIIKLKKSKEQLSVTFDKDGKILDTK